MRQVLGLVLAGSVLLGCAQPPLFGDIQKITVRNLSPRGMQVVEFKDRSFVETRDCLAQGSKPIPADQTDDILLQEGFIVEVVTGQGTRSYELFTNRNFKGENDTYFENRCILPLVQAAFK